MFVRRIITKTTTYTAIIKRLEFISWWTVVILFASITIFFCRFCFHSSALIFIFLFSPTFLLLMLRLILMILKCLKISFWKSICMTTKSWKWLIIHIIYLLVWMLTSVTLMITIILPSFYALIILFLLAFLTNIIVVNS